MRKSDHNNSITIAKALGIILMVIGHSGCPQYLFKIIYLFHMPLFFFCSGVFYKELSTNADVEAYLKKRVKGLYIPFVKWSIFFLFLHNFFLLIGIYNPYYGYDGGSVFYSISDVFQRICMILFTMNGYEELLGGFWFLRSLFVSCLLIAVVSFVFRCDFRYKYWFLCVLFLVATIVIRRIVPNIEFWREISMGCLGATFYMLGYVLMPFSRYWQNWFSCLVFCSFLLFFFYYFKAGISMGCGYNKVIPFTLSAISGTLFIIFFSKQLEANTSLVKRLLYYIGNHTLVILALHFLSFRFVSYLFVVVYGINVVHVAEHPVIKDICSFPSYLWIMYFISGITIPLLLNKLWHITINRI